MTATDTTGSTLLVAIDISKHRHEVLICVPGKKRRRRLTITNKALCPWHSACRIMPVSLLHITNSIINVCAGPIQASFRKVLMTSRP